MRRTDFFRVGQAFRNSLTAIFEDGQNRFVGKPVQQSGDNQEADDLGKEMRRVQAEFLRRAPGSFGQVAADASQQNELVHKFVAAAGRGAWTAPRHHKRYFTRKSA